MMEVGSQLFPYLLLDKPGQDFTVNCNIAVGRDAQMEERADHLYSALGVMRLTSSVSTVQEPKAFPVITASILTASLPPPSYE